jgi:predicted  nucleic acid-binding Zn-ribbon protein
VRFRNSSDDDIDEKPKQAHLNNSKNDNNGLDYYPEENEVSDANKQLQKQLEETQKELAELKNKYEQLQKQMEETKQEQDDEEEGDDEEVDNLNNYILSNKIN